MRKIILIIGFLFISLLWNRAGSSLFSQVMVNKGAKIYMANDIIFANGGISNLIDDSTGMGGIFMNSGSIYIKNSGTDNGDWTNSAGNGAFTDIAGTNGASDITCYLIGGNQNIQGTAVTEFHNLVLQGSGVKQLNNINAIVRDTLNLNDRELATGSRTVFVTNPAIPSIQLSTGFVSSLNGGALVRSTGATQSYLFPVGSSLGTLRYRPVEITPDNNFPNDYAVRMANVDATTESFDISLKKATVSTVNPVFYHQIRRDAGSANASITIYYDPNTDGEITGIGHWQNVPQWEDIPASPTANQFGFSAMNAPSWDFSSPSPAFALIKLLNECGEMFVPNAFSPDNNGENDMECVYGKCVKSLYFAIYDRWGEKVFETTDIMQCWDGTFRGKDMNTAVFVYVMRATLTTGEEVNKKGNISLIR
ncbi:MAG: gliding motility-associated C-terminal domain-containing protein [Bacteroidota bacterium]|nr:gliding motility-associated C-terminal domain-containing protein [Bacteroidota bacterium]